MLKSCPQDLVRKAVFECVYLYVCFCVCAQGCSLARCKHKLSLIALNYPVVLTRLPVSHPVTCFSYCDEKLIYLKTAATGSTNNHLGPHTPTQSTHETVAHSFMYTLKSSQMLSVTHTNSLYENTQMLLHVNIVKTSSWSQ